MLKISYGESNLRSLMEDGAFYQDRTHYIPVLENWGPKFLVYLRPRRFGKSLLLSTLEYYYGLEYKNEFDKIFGSTFIGKNPTPKAHEYMVLKFDFSGINTDNIKQHGDYPEEMLDANIATDYSKIQQLFKTQGKEEEYLHISA
jgi:Predicted AAA-ATPase